MSAQQLEAAEAVSAACDALIETLIALKWTGDKIVSKVESGGCNVQSGIPNLALTRQRNRQIDTLFPCTVPPAVMISSCLVCNAALERRGKMG